MTQGTLTPGRLAEHPVWRCALEAEELTARLVLPVIVSDAVEDREIVEGTGSLARLSITEAVREARAAAAAGIAGLLVYGATDRKDETALLASQRDHVVPRAIRAIKDAVPDLAVATDVCVCGYTTHGQCVLFREGAADIDGTLARLAEIALVHAEAGSDLLIPSGMLDGTVAALRSALAAEHEALPIAAMAKVESGLYAAQRVAVGAPGISERAVPLLDPTDRGAAEARVARDLAAGADAVVVKPALTALDLVASLAAATDRPVIAHHTVDEHALFSAESDVDGRAAERETLAASRRAGAQIVISYGALQ
ncbi:MAG: porphobilinogen synthase [Chloroflexota bacterium]|nr:porphobilinogen synthase [Chloroflexota bacterium]